MISLRMVGTEVSALGAAALSMPLRFVVERDRFDPSSPYPTPVVLVHGLFGDPTNFLLLRRYLARRGMRNFAAFSYPPRLDYQRLAPRLGDLIDAVCLAPGGAHPSYAHDFYARDNDFYVAWDSISRDRDTFRQWMEDHVLAA